MYCISEIRVLTSLLFMFTKISFAYSETVTGSEVSASMSITSSSVDFSAYKLIQNHAFRWLKHSKEKRISIFFNIHIPEVYEKTYHIHFKHAPIPYSYMSNFLLLLLLLGIIIVAFISIRVTTEKQPYAYQLTSSC